MKIYEARAVLARVQFGDVCEVCDHYETACCDSTVGLCQERIRGHKAAGVCHTDTCTDFRWFYNFRYNHYRVLLARLKVFFNGSK